MQAKFNNPSKYQEKIDPKSSHSLIKKILTQFQKGTRILDIGAGTGTIARLCINSGLEFWGIEQDVQSSEIAKPYYKNFYIGSIDSTPDEFVKKFDIIICADILEHLSSPEIVLTRLVELQDNYATFIISVPNVANIWVRLNLLFGKFNYSERGILDKTHLRFFTKDTFLKLVKDSGLSLLNIQATPIPFQLIYPRFYYSFVGHFFYHTLYTLTKLFPKLFGYQFICTALKRN